MKEDQEAVERWLREALDADSASIERLRLLASLLDEETTRHNLIAAATKPAIWRRHIQDSAQLLLCVPRGTVRQGCWIDLGSGAGFPGLVVAALQPERQMTLVESRRLRAEWLRRAAGELELPNVKVVHDTVERMTASPFNVISARAFAPLNRLLTLAYRFSTPETLWLLPKGLRAAQELAELEGGWETTFHVEQSLTEAAAGILVGSVLAGPTPHNNGSKS